MWLRDPEPVPPWEYRQAKRSYMKSMAPITVSKSKVKNGPKVLVDWVAYIFGLDYARTVCTTTSADTLFDLMWLNDLGDIMLYIRLGL